jgi:hypothetical protein
VLMAAPTHTARSLANRSADLPRMKRLQLG